MVTTPRPRRPKKPRAAPRAPRRGTSDDDPRDELPERSIGHDDLADALAEAALARATGDNDPEETLRDQEVDEDRGGPFVITPARVEFARGTDASNPADAFREPLPKVSRDDH